jgi:predicted transcriptional regulator
MRHVDPSMVRKLNGRMRHKIKIKKYRPVQDDFLPSSAIKKNKRSKILANLLYFKAGISHQKLADVMGIDRKTLRRYMSELVSEGYAKREKDKFGLYYPTTKALNQEVMIDALGNGLRKVLSYGYDCGRHGDIKLVKDWDDAQLDLFKFSNLLGALVTYILIQSVNPTNEFIEEKDHDHKKYRSPLLRESKWVEKILSQLINGIDLESEFHRKVYTPLTSLREVFQAYKELYPQIYTELCHIWDALPQQTNKIHSYSSDFI